MRIIIIGAGAAGLQAGRQLSVAGHSVIILEAGAQPGGRILTLPAGSASFSVPLECGAEFIHGDLALSLALAKEAGIDLQPVASEMVRMDQGAAEHKSLLSQDWGALMPRMAMLPEDRPLADFLDTEFPGERYAALRDSVGRMAEGYDLADLRTVSTRWLCREWSAEEEEEEEYRPAGGYRRMIDFLVGICRAQGCRLYFSTVVRTVRWDWHRVEVEIADGQVFAADRLLTTVSLGVLKAGTIGFFPAISRQLEAVQQLGFGSVIKVQLEFAAPFWAAQKPSGRTLFLVTGEPVPVWWTQPQDDCPLITAWISGERMRVFRRLGKEERNDSCLRSLAAIFSLEESILRAQLRASLVLDWEAAPAVLGGYSFDTVDAVAARKVLCEPVADTLYFAGEGLYAGSSPGTVEAAFCSGVEVAEKMMAGPAGGDAHGAPHV
jgi:monoamine oxidase